MSLRNLSRFRNYLVGSIGDLKRKTICVLAQIFPEYHHAFSDIFGKTSKELLLQLNSPNDYEDVTSKQLEELLSEVTLKGYAAKKFKEASSLAKTSFGITFCVDSFSFQLKLLIKQINFIEKQVSDVEKQISVLLEKIKTPITTIPGIGNVIGATILGEVGDINRFSSGAKLVAYAGIDASVSQSGEYECTNNHMSKRGSHTYEKLYLERLLLHPILILYLKLIIRKNVWKANITTLLLVQSPESYAIPFMLF